MYIPHNVKAKNIPYNLNRFNKMRKQLIFKMLKIVICALLSITLIFGVVAVPFYYSIIALTKPETVAMVIQEIDYKKVIEKNPAIKNTLDKYKITPAEADIIMKSKETGEMVEIYANEVAQIFLDIPEDKKLNVTYIKQIVKDNTDKFLDITEDNFNMKIGRKEAKQEVDTFFQNHEVIIEESVSMIEEVRDVVRTIYASRVLEKKLSFWIAIAFITVVFIVIAVIILLMRSNGFFWVGADFTVISILLGLIIVFSKSDFIKTISLKMSDFGTQIVESAISISTEKIIIALLGTIIITVLFFGFYVSIKLLKQKYQKREEIYENNN